MLFNGEKDYGRTIFLEELENGEIKITFIRFANEIKENDVKYIGFELID